MTRDDIMTWKHFLHYWPFVRGITVDWWIGNPPATSDFPSQRARFAPMFSLMLTWTSSWTSSGVASWVCAITAVTFWRSVRLVDNTPSSTACLNGANILEFYFTTQIALNCYILKLQCKSWSKTIISYHKLLNKQLSCQLYLWPQDTLWWHFEV